MGTLRSDPPFLLAYQAKSRNKSAKSRRLDPAGGRNVVREVCVGRARIGSAVLEHRNTDQMKSSAIFLIGTRYFPLVENVGFKVVPGPSVEEIDAGESGLSALKPCYLQFGARRMPGMYGHCSRIMWQGYTMPFRVHSHVSACCSSVELHPLYHGPR